MANRGGRGGWGGGGRGRESWGLVPWVKIDGNWHCLLQLSFSASLLTWKFDPFRGGREGQEDSQVTSAREAYEESAGVVDLRQLVGDRDAFGEAAEGLYHVRLEFTDKTAHPCDVSGVYDANRSLTVFHRVLDQNCRSASDKSFSASARECVGIAWVDISNPSSANVRFSAQVNRISEYYKKMNGENKFGESLRVIHVERREESFTSHRSPNILITWRGVDSKTPSSSISDHPRNESCSLSSPTCPMHDNDRAEDLWELIRWKLKHYPQDRGDVIRALSRFSKQKKIEEELSHPPSEHRYCTC
eukprot:GHVN01044624.1.p1 GENE.GHVN01044624.1~~GHVN01044624.1.p1  ORF type:complete len:303 (+),score=29.85 GHVN01044624.1:38-946(+)